MLLGIVNVLRFSQKLNAYSPIDTKVFGRFILSNFSQFEKALRSMFSIPFHIFISYKLSQPNNAYSPIYFKVSGKIILVKLSH